MSPTKTNASKMNWPRAIGASQFVAKSKRK